MTVSSSLGDYRAGDEIWCERLEPEDFAHALNRDVLVPRPAGRFLFGRLIGREGWTSCTCSRPAPARAKASSPIRPGRRSRSGWCGRCRRMTVSASGPLQLPVYAERDFGRLLDGRPYALPGFTLAPLKIEAIRRRDKRPRGPYHGRARPAIRRPIVGVVFAITPPNSTLPIPNEVDDMRTHH